MAHNRALKTRNNKFNFKNIKFKRNYITSKYLVVSNFTVQTLKTES